MVVAENLRPPGGGNSCLLGCCLVQSAQRYAHGLNQAAGVGPLSWPPRMSYQAALNTLHTRRDSRPLGSLKTAMWQSLLMTRLVVDPLLVTLRENCPQLDDLGHLQYCEVRCLTETHQVRQGKARQVYLYSTIQQQGNSLCFTYIKALKYSKSIAHTYIHIQH